MKITKIYTSADERSCFTTVDTGEATMQALGLCSIKYPVTALVFRDTVAGTETGWHNPHVPQYIIYLEGELEVEAGNGEKRIFKPGDILLAADLTGPGHVTRVLSKGKTLMISADPVLLP